MIKFVPVEEIPQKCKYKKIGKMLEEFMSMNIKVVELTFDENDYVNVRSAHASFYKSIKRYGFPINIKCVDRTIYLERRDIE